MEARPESGISLGDTEEVRGQIYSHPDVQVFIACHVAATVFAVDFPWVGFTAEKAKPLESRVSSSLDLRALTTLIVS